MIVDNPMVPGKAAKKAHRGGETRFRSWALFLAVTLGILAGAVAAGRIKLPIPW